MPFDDLPEFPQGQAVSSMHGAPGIPPEAFAGRALQATQGIMPEQKPEDIPAVRAVMGREADAVAQHLRLVDSPAQPSQPAPPASAPQPNTPVAPAVAAGVPPAPYQGAAPQQPRSREEQVLGIIGKYGGDLRTMAEAYLSTDAARVRAQQALNGRSEQDIRLDRAIGAIERLPEMIARGLDPRNGVQQPATTNAGPATPPAGAALPGITQEDFYRDPGAALARVVDVLDSRMDNRLRTHLAAYGEAQTRMSEAEREAANFAEFQRTNQQEIAYLRPVMDMVFNENPNLYGRLPRVDAWSLILDRARERVQAYAGRQAIEEAKTIFAASGEGAAVPGHGGTLPMQGAARAAAPMGYGGGAPPDGNWSGTQAMNRVMRSGNERDELAAVVDVLRERGHWANLV